MSRTEATTVRKPTPRGNTPSLGHQWIIEEEIEAVAEVLRGEWMTQGPVIRAFEERLAASCGARYGVAFSSGTAALHAACFAAGIGPGDEVITTPLTFVATANAVLYQQGLPVFADINPVTLTIDPDEIAARLGRKTKAILPMHFAGLPCDMERIAAVARDHRLTMIEDACHALGAEWRSSNGRWQRIGNCSHSDMAAFSFHPVKHITTGEGGIVVTNQERFIEPLRAFRHHGMTKAHHEGCDEAEPWLVPMRSLGYNYRITDFQCALGLKQLERLEIFLRRRREIAARYDDAFAALGLACQPPDGADHRHAWHLFVIQLPLERLSADRAAIFRSLRQAGVAVNVHYLPVHLQPYYRERFGFAPGAYPIAERYYERALSLPIFPRMSDEDVDRIIATVQDVLHRYRAT